MKKIAYLKKENKKTFSRRNLLSSATKKLVTTLMVLLFLAQMIAPFIISAENKTINNNGPFKAQAQGDTVNVDTWSDLEKLSSYKQGDAYVIDGNYTIKLDRDLVAYSPIIITGKVHISADSNKTIYRRKTDDNTVNDFTVFTVNEPGVLTLGSKVTMSAKIAKTLNMYTITLTDGYGRVLKTIDISSDDERTPLQILNAEGLSDESDEGKANILALIADKTGEDPTSPYNTVGYTLKNDKPWDMGMDDQRNNSMALVVKNNLLVKARWDVQEKNLTLTVTDGAGNTLFTSNDKTKTIQQLMEDNDLDVNAEDKSATEKSKIASKLVSSAESPAKDDNYSFNLWDSGGVDMTKTLTEIDGNVVVCAKWNEPENSTVWEEPEEIKENAEIKIQANSYYLGVNGSITTWEDDENSESIVWVLKNVAVENGRTTFEIHNKLYPEQKLLIDVNPSNRYTASPGEFKYNTSVSNTTTSQVHYRFYFDKVGNQVYLACYDTFYPETNYTLYKSVYLIGKDEQAIFFSDGTGHNVTAHAGVPTKEYPNPNTPGKTEVAGAGTPGGVQDVAGPKEPTGTTSSKMPIDTNSIETIRYTQGGFPGTQKFNQKGKGFFVQVNNGGALDIEGATLTDLRTGRLDGNGVFVNNTSVTESAPVVVDGGNLNFTDGEIKNNEVGYMADDSKSGKQVTGGNRDGNSVKDYLKGEPTKTAGGIIFKNGAKGTITGDASIKQNKADAGGIIVTGTGTDVTLGGKVVFSQDSEGNDVSEIDSTLGGGHINQNVGFHYAGAAQVDNGGTFRMVAENSTMSHNVTWNRGGAVYVTEFGTAGDGKGVRKDRNNKKLAADQPGRGATGTFIMTNGSIDNNTAFVRGGGINVETNNCFLVKGEIHDNNCRSLGGGIYVEGDFADYSYTLIINKGYIGTNYSVRYWNLNDDVLNNSETSNYKDWTVTQLNNRLDRKLGAYDNNGNPLFDGYSGNITSSANYPNRTADAVDFYNPFEGKGGGVWLCPIGGTAVFHMNADNEVIIDDNFASGRNHSDKTKGTDIYLERGDGHILVANKIGTGQILESWYNEQTGLQIPENGPAYSGPLALINKTLDSESYAGVTYGQRKDKEKHDGVHIVDNISRNGGGIAADGTVLFGIPNDVYRHNAELDFSKIWPDTSIKHNVTFKMYYEDEDGSLVELNDYGFKLTNENTDNEAYEINPQNGTLDEVWKARVTIPTSITKEFTDEQGNKRSVPYPLYKLKYTGTQTIRYSLVSATETEIVINPNDIIDPSTVEGMKKLYGISNYDHKNGTTTHLEIVEWKIVIKEFDENGKEVRTAEFSEISSDTVTVSWDASNSIPMYVVDAGGRGKIIPGYNINFSTIKFASKVKNGNGPEVEKYIKNKVHHDLLTFDEVFEYEIMAYVPIGASEIIIYDTLEEPLMFVSTDSGNPQQYVLNEETETDEINTAFQQKFNNNNTGNFFLIKNDSTNNQLMIYDDNDHYGDGYGTVSKSGTPFSQPVAQDAGSSNNPMNAGNVWIAPSSSITTDNNGKTTASNSAKAVDGDTLIIKIDKTSGIQAVQGKWVRVAFKAAIKPSYRSLEKLKHAGWLENKDSKVGYPMPDYQMTITYPENSDWNILSGIENLGTDIDKQFITKAAKKTGSNYIFATDGTNYYVKDESITDGSNQWYRLSEGMVEPDPTINYAKKALGELGSDRDGYTNLNLTKNITYKNADDFLLDGAKFYESDGTTLITEPVVIVQGAYGNSLPPNGNIFVKDSNGNYYATPNTNLVRTNDKKYSFVNGKTIDDIKWVKLTKTSTPSIANAEQKMRGEYIDRPMTITTYGYNWPIIDTNEHMSQQPHQGEANQANMVVNGRNTYKTNIVTVDVVQPEKYVEHKVHHLLNKGDTTGAEGAFDEPFEYQIMVFVPGDATEVIIYDTLRPDLMFVDANGNTQYETFTIGVTDNNNSTNVNDVSNAKFHRDDSGNYINNAMVVNSDTKFQLAFLDNNNHIGNGTDSNASVRQSGTRIDNFTAIVGTLQNSASDGSTKLSDNLYIIESKDSNNNLTGKTLAVKIDNPTTMKAIQGKWVKLSFKAEIKPSAYDEVVRKLEKQNEYTTDKTKASDYNSENNNATPIGYLKKSAQYTFKKEEARGYNGTVPPTSIKYINLNDEFNTASGDVVAAGLTTNKTEAIDYNTVTHEASYKFEAINASDNSKLTIENYARKDNQGNFTLLEHTKPSGVLNQDWVYAYVKNTNTPSDTKGSQYVEVYVKEFDTLYKDSNPTGEPGVDYVYVYNNKDWDNTETWANNNVANNTGKPNWEKVTNNGHIITPEDTDDNGVHAGLANDATYIVKDNSGYLTNKTNTVTVETKLRDLLFFKKWVVKDSFEMPSMEEFKNSIHLMWEKVNEGSHINEKKTGEITSLYKDNIKVTYNEDTNSDGETRYYWKVSVTGLPVLRESLKYYLVEDQIDGLNAPEYRNDDPTYGDKTTEHAHHYGTIVNIQKDEPGYTHVSVLKNWDVGSLTQNELDKINAEQVKVQLMMRDSYTNSLVPVYKRGDNNVITTDKVETTLTSTSNSPWSYTFTDLPEYELTDSGDIRPKKDSDGYLHYYDKNDTEFKAKINNNALIIKDLDGTDITNHDERGIDLRINNNEIIIGGKTQPVPVKVQYEIEVKSDPDGFILSKEVNIHRQYQTVKIGLIPTDRNKQLVQELGYYYVFEGDRKVVFTNIEDYERDCFGTLPETGGKVGCYIEEIREFNSYEFELVNTRPQIEKYVNKDVHDEIYFVNDIVYDILVYVPEEATEIVIEDQVLDTLKLKAFMKPVEDASNLISGYQDVSLTETSIPLAVHVRNDHKIFGTVSSKNTAGYVNGNVSVDGNSFKITIPNIVHWSAEYVADENGDYVKTSASNGYTKVRENGEYLPGYNENLDEKLKEEGIYRKDYSFYKKLDIRYEYKEDPNGLYAKGSDGQYHLITDLPITITDTDTKYIFDAKSGEYVENSEGTHYKGSDGKYYTNVDTNITRVDEDKAYTLVVDSRDTYNAIGGRYVQVTFKATLNHSKDDELKEFIDGKNTIKPTSPNEEFDWDVITATGNTGWDSYVRQTLISNNHTGNEEYIEYNPVYELASYLKLNNKELDKVTSDNTSYYARAKDGSIYQYRRDNHQEFGANNNKWFKVQKSSNHGERTIIIDITNNEIALKPNGDIAWLGYNYDPIVNKINGEGTQNENINNIVPVVPNEVYYKEVISDSETRYYLTEVFEKYAPEDKLDTVKNNGKFLKVDWGRGDGDVIREYPDNYEDNKYVDNHTGIVNTASYTVTYGNGIKSHHKSNTVTVVPQIYELPSSGGIGTFLFNILGVMFMTLALTEFVLKKRKRKFN